MANSGHQTIVRERFAVWVTAPTVHAWAANYRHVPLSAV